MRRSVNRTPTFAVIITLFLAILPLPESTGAREGISIAVLAGSQQKPFMETLEGYRNHLHRQQQNIDFSLHFLDENGGNLSDIIQNISRLQPDLVFALGSDALEAASHIAGKVPIVAGMILRKKDFQHFPTSTGVYLEFPPETQFSWLRRILPGAKTVGVLYNRNENSQNVAAASRAAEAEGLELKAQSVDDARELPAALKDLSRQVDVLWGLSDEVVLTPQTARHILLFSFRQRIPFIGLSEAWVKAGAFYALDRDYRDIGRQCAEISLDVLAGKSVGEMSPRAPRKIIYTLNIKTARQMRIELPGGIVRDAAKTY